MKITSFKNYSRDLLTLATITLVLLATRSSLADHYYVPSGSMQPTVAIGDHILVNKFAYGLRVPFSNIYLAEFEAPVRGEVVILESPEDGTLLVKRVAAQPGDMVQVQRGRLTINGQPQPLRPTANGLSESLGDNPHLIQLDYGGGPNYGPQTIPDGYYLVLGDNRGNSHDGRIFGLVPRHKILGRAAGVFWRASRPTWKSL